MRVQNLIDEASSPGAIPKWWWRPDQGFVELIPPYVHHSDLVLHDRARFGIPLEDFKEIVSRYQNNAESAWPITELAMKQGWVRIGATGTNGGSVYMQANTKKLIQQCALEFARSHRIDELTLEAPDAIFRGPKPTLRGRDLELFLKRGVVRVTEDENTEVEVDQEDEPISEAPIKLTGFGRQGDPEEAAKTKRALDMFMAQYNSQTRPNLYNPKQRIVGDNEALIELCPFGKSIHLSSVQAVRTGQGGGTRTMELLKQIADRTGVSISGFAKAYKLHGQRTPSTAKLVQWYRSLGFEVDTEGNILYQPIQTNTNLNENEANLVAWILPDGHILTGYRHEKIAADYWKMQADEQKMENRDRSYDNGWVRILQTGNIFGADFKKTPTRQQLDMLRTLVRESPVRDYFITHLGMNQKVIPLLKNDALRELGAQISGNTTV